MSSAPLAKPKPPEKKTGIPRLLRACLYSYEGLVATFRSEAAFRQELALAAVLIPLAFRFAPSRPALAAMVASVLLVLIVELLNSAVEATVNRFGSEWNEHFKQAKDAGSAAVFIALANVAAVWAICLF